MGQFKYIFVSLLVHGFFILLFLASSKLTSRELREDSPFLLMGANNGDKLTENKTERKKQKSPVKAVLETDPDALKTNDKPVAVESGTASSEGSMGEGGTKVLEYFDELAAWLRAKKVYPPVARKLGQECEKIQLEFNIHPDGSLTDVVLREKCPHERLNKAAVELVKNAGNFKPFPDQFPKTVVKKVFDIEYAIGM